MAPHIVFASTPHLGHFRTLCVLISRIVVEKEVTITLVVSNRQSIISQLAVELRRSLAEVTPKGVIRVVGYGERLDGPMNAASQRLSDFEPVWKALAAGQSVTCSSAGTVFEAAPAPKFIVVEQFMHSLIPFVRSHSPDTRIGSWSVAAAGAYTRAIFPASLGGFAERLLVLPPPGGTESTPPIPIALTGEIHRIPGIPPFYDYEAYPQDHAVPAALMPMMGLMTRTFWEADFAVTAFWTEYESEAVRSITEWNRERGKSTYNLGPLLATQPGSTEFSKTAMEAEISFAPGTLGIDILAFLDNSLKKFGPNSLIFIAFGTYWWPSKTAHLTHMLVTLAAHDIPFIIATPSPATVLPDEIKKAFSNSDVGFIAEWAPQQTILAHEATGWFITHAGYNSAIEAISQGVPLITWPIGADQPIQSMHLEKNLDVAFELKEVRGGNGLRPALATGRSYSGTLEAFKEEFENVIRDAKGPAGTKKRANMVKLQDTFLRSWKQGGSAFSDMQRFLEMLGTATAT